MSYPSQFTLSKQAPLSNGRFDQRAVLSPEEAAKHPATVNFHTAVIGTDYAAVLLATNTGGSGTFFTLHFVSTDGTRIEAGPGLLLGDRWRVQGLELKDGVVVLNTVRPGANDPLCCPSLAETHYYVRDASTGAPVEVAAPAQPIAGPGAPPSAQPIPPATGSAGLLNAGNATVQLALAALAFGIVLLARRFDRARLTRHPRCAPRSATGRGALRATAVLAECCD
jgi:hypothetical protein